MDKVKTREFYNTQVNRYVRNHATNVIAKPNPGSEYRHIRTLAKAVIYQALVDAVNASIEHERQYQNLLNNNRFWKKELEYMYEGIKVVSFKSIYGKRMIWTSADPESIRFFNSKDYEFYSGLAGIDMPGDRLLKIFKERRRERYSIDSLIDG